MCLVISWYWTFGVSKANWLQSLSFQSISKARHQLSWVKVQDGYVNKKNRCVWGGTWRRKRDFIRSNELWSYLFDMESRHTAIAQLGNMWSTSLKAKLSDTFYWRVSPQHVRSSNIFTSTCRTQTRLKLKDWRNIQKRMAWVCFFGDFFVCFLKILLREIGSVFLNAASKW